MESSVKLSLNQLFCPFLGVLQCTQQFGSCTQSSGNPYIMFRLLMNTDVAILDANNTDVRHFLSTDLPAETSMGSRLGKYH